MLQNVGVAFFLELLFFRGLHIRTGREETYTANRASMGGARSLVYYRFRADSPNRRRRRIGRMLNTA